MQEEYINNQEEEIKVFYKEWLKNDINSNLFKYLNLIKEIRYGSNIKLTHKSPYNSFFKKHDDVICNTHLSFYSFESMNEEQFRQYFINSGCYDNVLDMLSDYKMLFETPDYIVNEYYKQKEMELI